VSLGPGFRRDERVDGLSESCSQPPFEASRRARLALAAVGFDAFELDQHLRRKRPDPLPTLFDNEDWSALTAPPPS